MPILEASQSLPHRPVGALCRDLEYPAPRSIDVADLAKSLTLDFRDVSAEHRLLVASLDQHGVFDSAPIEEAQGF